MKLRTYQQQASTAALEALRAGLHPALQLPTGSGKSAIIADISDYIVKRDGKVLVLAHVQELLIQNRNTYQRLTGQNNAGIYSAGLGLSEDSQPLVFAGVQSVYRKPSLFLDRDLVIIDEAHSVPPDGEGLMYSSFLGAIPARRMGFTATPFRLDGGVIYGEGKPFDVLAYEKSPLELVEEGWLAPLVGVDSKWSLDMKGVGHSGGDFNSASVQERMEANSKWMESAVTHTLSAVKTRKHVAVFAPTLISANKLASLIKEKGNSVVVVSAETPDRGDLIAAWKAGEIKFLVNVNIITTGIDFPELDCIACFRPTESTGLWQQMLGRGMRIAQGKTDCLILDYVGNLARLGGVGSMETWSKEKSDGTSVQGTRTAKAGKVIKQARYALDTLDPMLDSKQGLSVNVVSCTYITRPCRLPGVSMLMAVYDTVTEDGLPVSAHQCVCVEHKGGARWHAQQWFKKRGYNSEVPKSSRAAKVLAYELPVPKKLVLRREESYVNVIREVF